MKDKELARKSHQEERKAVRDYGKRRDEAENKGLKKTFTHARNEEKEHAKAFAKYK